MDEFELVKDDFEEDLQIVDKQEIEEKEEAEFQLVKKEEKELKRESSPPSVATSSIVDTTGICLLVAALVCVMLRSFCHGANIMVDPPSATPSTCIPVHLNDTDHIPHSSFDESPAYELIPVVGQIHRPAARVDDHPAVEYPVVVANEIFPSTSPVYLPSVRQVPNLIPRPLVVSDELSSIADTPEPVLVEYYLHEQSTGAKGVDCVTSFELCVSLEITEFPTLRWYFLGDSGDFQFSNLDLWSHYAEKIAQGYQDGNEIFPKSAFTDINGYTFDDFTQQKSLVVFYHPHARFEEIFRPRLVSVQEVTGIPVGLVNCRSHPGLCNVSRFPTVRVYENGKYSELQGKRTALRMVEHIKMH